MYVCVLTFNHYVYNVFFRFIQAKLLQSSEVTGVHPNKPAYTENASDLPKKNRYDPAAGPLLLNRLADS